MLCIPLYHIYALVMEKSTWRVYNSVLIAACLRILTRSSKQCWTLSLDYIECSLWNTISFALKLSAKFQCSSVTTTKYAVADRTVSSHLCIFEWRQSFMQFVNHLSTLSTVANVRSYLSALLLANTFFAISKFHYNVCLKLKTHIVILPFFSFQYNMLTKCGSHW